MAAENAGGRKRAREVFFCCRCCWPGRMTMLAHREIVVDDPLVFAMAHGASRLTGGSNGGRLPSGPVTSGRATR